MTHTREISRQSPGCLLFLVDQSGSMSEPFAGDEQLPKSRGVADALNQIILELILKSVKDPNEGPRHYFDVAVIGYGATVGSAFSGALTGREMVSIVELAEHPMVPEQPIWLEPVAAGQTPMGEAINAAGSIAARWANAHLDSFPPIAVNISDGAATDEVALWVERFRSIETNDGNALLFNLNIARFPDEPVMFPSTTDVLPNEYAQALFDHSSVLPPTMYQEAARFRPLQPGARGFGYNGDFNALVDFLVTGTQVNFDRPT